MKRSPLTRKTPLRPKRHEPSGERESKPRALLTPAKTLHTATYSGTTSGKPIAKEDPVRSETYLRLVAARPCKNCGREKHSQAAHVPPDAKGMKRSDLLTMPLCADDIGVRGCHWKFDNYILFPREQAVEKGMQWAKETQAEIFAEGNWPRRLPRWSN